jgi:hypothetical protein
MVLSSKQHRCLPTISEERDGLSTVSTDIQTLPQTGLVTLADFDIIPSSGYPMLCRKRSTKKVYVIKALEPCTRQEPHIEQAVMEVIHELRSPFLERVHWSFPGVLDGDESRTYLVLVRRCSPFGSYF